MTFRHSMARWGGRAEMARVHRRTACGCATWTGAALLVGGGVAGCAPAIVATRAADEPVSALCIVADAERRDRLKLAVAEPIARANAPVPRNAAERLVFRQLYETLVRVDCDGRVRPALAESWTVDETGRAWQFRLRRDARFADGSPAMPADVVASWSAPAAAEARTAAGITGVADAGGGVLLVALRTPIDGAHVFAHAALAVARPAAGNAWPAGSGGYRVDAADRRVLRLISGDDASHPPRALAFHVSTSPDSRAALDAGADALVASDAAALAYARALGGYAVTPLPWSRTYVFATRGPGEDAHVPAAALESLATLTLRGAARPAQQALWWREPTCRVPEPAAPMPAGGVPAVGGGAIVYERGDAAGRAIAERLVALAWPAGSAPAWLRALLPRDYGARGTPPTALGLDRGALLDALARPGGLAFVLALPRTGGAVCAAPAIAGDAALHSLLFGTRDWRVTPLLDARDHLIHRTGLGRVIVDGDGALVFAPGER
jgi:hypothetical protein